MMFCCQGAARLSAHAADVRGITLCAVRPVNKAADTARRR